MNRREANKTKRPTEFHYGGVIGEIFESSANIATCISHINTEHPTRTKNSIALTPNRVEYFVLFCVFLLTKLVIPHSNHWVWRRGHDQWNFFFYTYLLRVADYHLVLGLHSLLIDDYSRTA